MSKSTQLKGTFNELVTNIFVEKTLFKIQEIAMLIFSLCDAKTFLKLMKTNSKLLYLLSDECLLNQIKNIVETTNKRNSKKQERFNKQKKNQGIIIRCSA